MSGRRKANLWWVEWLIISGLPQSGNVMYYRAAKGGKNVNALVW